MSKTKNRYFAQDFNCDAFNHRAKYFPTFNDAVDWLKSRGGGTIKKRIQHIATVEVDGTITHHTRKNDWE
ncbi:hypothetical protein [Microseira sp. BLCC-F43]|jgi:uncharacterized SAM-dependent methyltransferase|uniref:hypothetical protein n=1 Tax=Microseira sp. BLCC-F43 TaxID=3153602 RepID=UPI0035B7B56C